MILANSESQASGRVNVHLYQTPFTHESRMLKITETLSKLGVFSQIVVIATWQSGLSESEILAGDRDVRRVRTRWAPAKCGLFGKLLQAAEWQCRVLRVVVRLRPICINCHNVWLLPLCVVAKFACRSLLVYDTHELETETAASHGVRRLVSKAIERYLVRFVDEVFVVSESIADWYRAAYRLTNVHVVRNLPRRRQKAQRSTAHNGRLRATIGAASDDLVYLYQGVLGNGRGIELLLDAFTRLPRLPHGKRYLVFLGGGPLESLIGRHSEETPCIRHLPAVPPESLADWTVEADVGLALIENVSLSYYYCLPNKLFEYLGAGLPVIVSDFPEMAAVVNEYGCGWTVPVTVDGVASLIAGISREDLRQRHTRIGVCRGKLVWECEEGTLSDVYQRRFAPARGVIPPSEGCLLTNPLRETA